MVLRCDFLCKTLCCLWYSNSAFDLGTHSTFLFGKGLLWTLVFLYSFLCLALNLSAELWIVACFLNIWNFPMYKVVTGYFVGLCDCFCLDFFCATIL